MSLYRQICCAALLALMLSSGSSGQSIGFWNLPSTQAQYCGLGCGPGHHAPMIRTRGCVPLRVPRFVHIRGCLSGGLAYCEYLPGEFESPGYHAELDALVTPDYDYARPEDSILTPDAEDQLFPLPDVSCYQSLPAPANPSQSSLQD